MTCLFPHGRRHTLQVPQVATWMTHHLHCLSRKRQRCPGALRRPLPSALCHKPFMVQKTMWRDGSQVIGCRKRSNHIRFRWKFTLKNYQIMTRMYTALLHSQCRGLNGIGWLSRRNLIYLRAHRTFDVRYSSLLYIEWPSCSAVVGGQAKCSE